MEGKKWGGDDGHKMKKLIIFFIISTSCFAQQQEWYWQNPWPQGNDLRDVHFIDSTTGWAISGSGTIIKTTDAGKSWNKQIFNFNSGLEIIFFSLIQIPVGYYHRMIHEYGKQLMAG